ncbi:hypothetical protein DORFOR_02968 [Dorea formicigenerans ATCC 27755]|uniref:Uncharacterized protein n=1 Tax=Dorea formicigenerans ATCC 27755 TaxID=411461 RepID=B0G9K2_9FIRM|nr:hypothetical protein DORFOR_02968 [Dorea formicigenerans ATCC 27755]
MINIHTFSLLFTIINSACSTTRFFNHSPICKKYYYFCTFCMLSSL